MNNDPITLETELPGLVRRSLTVAVAMIKAEGSTRLLIGLADVSENVRSLRGKLGTDQSPTIGEVLAAYYVASVDQLEAQFYADDSVMSERSYSQRFAAICRVVFREGTAPKTR
jgi:hypothetical protein